MVRFPQRRRVPLRVKLRLAVQQDKQRLSHLQGPPARDGGVQEGLLKKISDGVVSAELLLPLWKRGRHFGGRLKRDIILQDL
jgi:hypothetical protein